MESVPVPSASSTASCETDFDFFEGRWQVSHRRLKERLAGCTDWEVFSGTTQVQKTLGGLGNMDDNCIDLPGGAYRALTLRTFDPATHNWSIWWLDGREPGRLDTPLVGRFEGAQAEFFADDVLRGQPIKIRFRWDARDPNQPTWGQAFSGDAGLTWEPNWEMRFSRMGGSAPLRGINVLELRQYTLHAGQRDVLIDLFDREFVESQEAVGMAVLGQFRDEGNPDRFVWLRGFPDMPSRRDSLTSFYGGPVWRAHRSTANATMIDSQNVLLLRPAWPGSGLPFNPALRSAPDEMLPPGMLDVSIFHLKAPANEALLTLCREKIVAVLAAGGALTQAWYISEHSENTFPGLPVRLGEQVLVGVALFQDAAALDTFIQSGVWARELEPALAPWLMLPTESLRLAPTARSALHA